MSLLKWSKLFKVIWTLSIKWFGENKRTMMIEQYKYMVCIHCMTYNHEKYLADALEGFVMQRTNFPFVAVVIDDFSTDGTADILRKYEAKYPDIIKAVYLQENYYSQRKPKKPLLEPYDSQSKYIAICEGDDYWTDPYKLQKQVDFLESHDDYSMCFHAAEIKNETDSNVRTICDKIEDREYFTNDIFPAWVVPTASVVYRKAMIDSHPPLKHLEKMRYGDIVLFLKCTHMGHVWGMSNKMSVYRMTEKGEVISHLKDESYWVRHCQHYDFLMENFPQLDKKWPNAFIATYYYSKFRNSNKMREKIDALCVAIKHDVIYVVKKVLRMPTHYTY